MGKKKIKDQKGSMRKESNEYSYRMSKAVRLWYGTNKFIVDKIFWWMSVRNLWPFINYIFSCLLIYNKLWRRILVPQYGLMHLELIPMLVGFFTYKVSTFIQAIEAAVSVYENPDDWISVEDFRKNQEALSACVTWELRSVCVYSILLRLMNIPLVHPSRSI